MKLVTAQTEKSAKAIAVINIMRKLKNGTDKPATVINIISLKTYQIAAVINTIAA